MIVFCSVWLTENSDVDEETMKANSQGFIGCLSSVQFNHIAPLKSALHHSSSAPIIVKGRFTESSCGTSTGADSTLSETTHSFAGSIHLQFSVFMICEAKSRVLMTISFTFLALTCYSPTPRVIMGSLKTSSLLYILTFFFFFRLYIFLWMFTFFIFIKYYLYHCSLQLYSCILLPLYSMWPVTSSEFIKNLFFL